MDKFLKFIVNAHKANTRESSTRMYSTLLIAICALLLIAVIVAYIVSPTTFGQYTAEIILALSGIIALAFGGKVISGRNEHRYPYDYKDIDDDYRGSKNSQFNNKTDEIE